MDLKQFFRSVARNVKREVVSEIRSAQFTKQNQTSQQAPPSQQNYQPQQAAQPQQRERTDQEWVAYFKEIITKEFSQYSFRENVTVQELAGNLNEEFQLYKSRPRQAYRAEWGQPYTFVLYEGGIARGVIMLGKGHSHDSNVKYLIARKYANRIQLPYINFYTQMPNERDYVIARIKKLMDDAGFF